MLYKRNLPLPSRSFFLFGPRGTGKTTWLRQELPKALWFDLLDTRTFFGLNRNPGLLGQKAAALPEGSWVVIDEVQKLPVLLDEVQKIMGEKEEDVRFALSGSSARKLKRMGGNLLAGRALNRSFFPLTYSEMLEPKSLSKILPFGTLPSVRKDPAEAVGILEAYATNYLKEEIQQEALTKDLGSFSRFLEVAALCNGQIVNVSNIARDAGVARPTVQRYFDILVDTLIGAWLFPWKKRIKIKEIGHPKFYFFDTGVVRALMGRLHDPMENSERGPLLETLVFHELRAWQNVSQCGGQLYFWRTPTGTEVDFVWSRGNTAIGLEVKASKEWRPEYSRALKLLIQEKAVNAGFGIYGGDIPLKDGPIYVYPFPNFIAQLEKGKILPPGPHLK